MHFLVDAQLPPALARYFEQQGYKATAVRNVSLRDADDDVIWEYARQPGWMVVSKDEDFAQRARRQGTPPQVMWLRIGNATNRALPAWLAPRLPDTLAVLVRGNAVVEVR